MFLQAVRAAAAGRKTFEAELSIRTATEARRDLLVSCAFPPTLPLGRVLISLVDVTERKRAQQLALDARRAHEAAALAATETERRRLARELHDGALQELAALKLLLEAESKRHGAPPLTSALERTASITREVRAVVEDLQPPELARGSLAEAIANHAQILTGARTIALRCDTRPSVCLPDWVAREVYRIAQEAIGNAVAHGRPRHLTVRLWQHSDAAGLAVEGDGCGFDDTTARQGLGLANMRDRAAAISATLTIDSRPSHGRGCGW